MPGCKICESAMYDNLTALPFRQSFQFTDFARFCRNGCIINLQFALSGKVEQFAVPAKSGSPDAPWHMGDRNPVFRHSGDNQKQ